MINKSTNDNKTVDATRCPCCQSEEIENGTGHDLISSNEVISFGSCFSCGATWQNNLTIKSVTVTP